MREPNQAQSQGRDHHCHEYCCFRVDVQGQSGRCMTHRWDFYAARHATWIYIANITLHSTSVRFLACMWTAEQAGTSDGALSSGGEVCKGTHRVYMCDRQGMSR